MLSILIPTYNYNVVPLVLELKKQADKLVIDYEILAQDDGGVQFAKENAEINNLNNCSYFINSRNVGRGQNINALVEKANLEYLLILDCDTYPTSFDFIKNYISAIKSSQKVVFGGIKYKKDKPNKEQLLRWIYGNSRESLSVNDRKKDPYGKALTSNILIHKSVFSLNKFDESIAAYGYEDLVFLFDLKKTGIKVKHIDNTTYHLGLETSKQFLEKTKIALKNLNFIAKNSSLENSSTKILKIHSILKRYYLVPIISSLFKIMEQYIHRNLLSSKPNLFLFDLYKLGYFCSIKNDEK